VLKPSPFRAVLAWAAACLIGVCLSVLGTGLAHVLFDDGAWLSLETFVLASSVLYLGALAFIAPLSLLMVFVIRKTGIRRPWADTVGGASVAISGVFAADAVGELVFYGHIVRDGTALIPHALLSGLLAGPVYWWLACKPRPPYSRYSRDDAMRG
jgi:hypothetical protein